jgi:two-component system, sensor histidine kinase and response regulator
MFEEFQLDWPLIAAACIALPSLAAVIILALRQRGRLRVLRDEQAALWAQLRDARRELDLARKRARELITLARSAKAIRNEFLSNISHEVRTPMNTIVGMTELSLASSLNPKQRHYLEQVREAAGSLLGLVNDLLDLAKIHTRRLELSPVPFRMTECLNDVVGKFRPRAVQKGLRLELHIEPDVPSAIVGDPGRLRQVVAALLSNAIKFTEKGGVDIYIGLESRVDREICLHGRVVDTGIGIAPDKHGLIFEAFRQSDGSETRAHGGCGLGLAIASELAIIMGGRLWLESTVDFGSTFHFTVRFRTQDEAAVRQAGRDFSELRGLEVLVAHEDRTIRQALEELLLSLRMRPVAADSAEAAMAAMTIVGDTAGAMPLAVIGDTVPPEGGFDLAARILGDPVCQYARVLLVAVAGKRGDAARCRRLGISAYLTFPVTRTELAESMLASMECGTPKSGAELITKHWLQENRPRSEGTVLAAVRPRAVAAAPDVN